MVCQVVIPCCLSLTLPIQSQWEVRLSSSRGVPYFFNVETRASSWEPPAELSPEQISQLPGADKYLVGSGGKSSSGENAQVRASHLLVKHRDSRRASSWKEVRAIHPPTYSSCHFSKFLFSFVILGQHHALEGRGHRNSPGLSSADQRICGEIRRACDSALGLFFAYERR